VQIPFFEATMTEVSGAEMVRVKHFRKGRNARIDDGEGLPSFAELVVASRFQRAGWNAVWRNNWAASGFYQSWAWDADLGVSSNHRAIWANGCERSPMRFTMTRRMGRAVAPRSIRACLTF
jgi:hypothetical protein